MSIIYQQTTGLTENLVLMPSVAKPLEDKYTKRESQQLQEQPEMKPIMKPGYLDQVPMPLNWKFNG